VAMLGKFVKPMNWRPVRESAGSESSEEKRRMGMRMRVEVDLHRLEVAREEETMVVVGMG
jgi:hypothetical protein